MKFKDDAKTDLYYSGDIVELIIHDVIDPSDFLDSVDAHLVKQAAQLISDFQFALNMHLENHEDEADDE